MKWDAKTCMLVLFLCMVFVLVVGYGAFSFGGDMGSCCWKQIVSIIAIALLLFFGVYGVICNCICCSGGNCSCCAAFTLQIRDACGCCRCERFKESEIYPNECFENAKKILIVGEKDAKNFLEQDFKNLKKSDIELYFVLGKDFQKFCDEIVEPLKNTIVEKMCYENGVVYFKVHKD